jgi:hypothetical protein
LLINNQLFEIVMPEFRISEFADLLDIPHTKAKRYTREFLGPDPEATIQSGRTRSLTLQQTFIVYSGAHLVSGQNFTVYEAKLIIGNLQPWLTKLGLFPGDDNIFKETSSEIKSWKVLIYRTDKPFGFAYLAEGLLSLENAGSIKIGDFDNIPVQRKKFVQIAIENLDPVSPWAVRWDSDAIKFFRASFLKDVFKHKIEGKRPAKSKHLKVKNLGFYFD